MARWEGPIAFLGDKVLKSTDSLANILDLRYTSYMLRFGFAASVLAGPEIWDNRVASPAAASLIPQAGDGIESRGAARRNDARHQCHTQQQHRAS